jgi:hypothetical protein
MSPLTVPRARGLRAASAVTGWDPYANDVKLYVAHAAGFVHCLV